MDYSSGGFVCRRCVNNYETIESVDYLKSLRYIFMVNEDKYFHYELNKSLSIRIINELIDYLQKQFDYKKLYFYDLFKSTF